MAVLIRKRSGFPIAGVEKVVGRSILGGDLINTKVLDWYEQVIDTTLGDGLNQYQLLNNSAFITPNADVSWGDGSVESVSGTSYTTHPYSSSGTYNIRVVGFWKAGKSNSYPSASGGKITDVLRWGILGESGGINFDGGFFRYENAIGTSLSAPDQPYVPNILSCNATFRDISNTSVDVSWFTTWTFPTSAVSFREVYYNYKGTVGAFAQTAKPNSLQSAMQSAPNVNPNVTNWDTTGLGSMRGVAIFANAFTGVGLPSWDISGVTDLYLGFFGCSINQDVSGWQFNSVGDARSLFSSQQGGIFNCGDTPATSPASPGNKLLSWNFPLATNLSNMFSANVGFNQNMPRVTTVGSEAWDFPATLIDINSMFNGCVNFNGNIDNWNVSNVENMSQLFRNCDGFTRDLSGWNVSSVTSLASIFQDKSGPINGISSWNTSSNTFLSRSFSGTTDNPDITGWDVSKVTTMYQMAYNNGANFTRDLSGWNTESLESANVAFYNDNIDFSFGDWNLQNLITITGMTQNASLSDANVADSLEGWYERGAAPNTGVSATNWCGVGAVGRSMSQTTYADAKTAFDALSATVVNLTSGTATSLVTSKLVDSAADFVTDGIAQYDWVRNTTSGETAIVTAVDNSTTLSLTKDVFKGTGAAYEIGRNYGWDMTNSITWVA